MNHPEDLDPAGTAELLGPLSPSMCFAKWQQVLLNLQAATSASCCLATVRPLPAEAANRPTLLHNSAEQISERGMLWKGERPAACGACWKAEDAGLVSDRLWRSGASWAHGPASDLTAENHLDPRVPSYLEVGFSSLCQLSCGYCSPTISSGVEAETRQWGSLPDRTGHHPVPGTKVYRDDEENPYVEAFFNWLPEIAPRLRVLRVTGGEPLLSRHTARLFGWMKQHSHPEMDLQINTNLAMPTPSLAAMCQRIREIPVAHYRRLWIVTSLDGMGPGSEAMRFGLSVERWVKNVALVREIFPDAEFRVTATVNIFSLHEMQALVEHMRGLKRAAKRPDQVMLIAYPLVEPAHLSLAAAPPAWRPVAKRLLEDLGQDFLPTERSLLEKALRPLLEDGAPGQRAGLAIDACLHLHEVVRRGRLRPREVPALQALMGDAEPGLQRWLGDTLPGESPVARVTRLLRVWPSLEGTAALIELERQIRRGLEGLRTLEVNDVLGNSQFTHPRYQRMFPRLVPWLTGEVPQQSSHDRLTRLCWAWPHAGGDAPRLELAMRDTLMGLDPEEQYKVYSVPGLSGAAYRPLLRTVLDWMMDAPDPAPLAYWAGLIDRTEALKSLAPYAPSLGGELAQMLWLNMAGRREAGSPGVGPLRNRMASGTPSGDGN